MKTVLDVFKERGLIESMTSDTLSKYAQCPFKAYIGFDPTSDSLHLGHLLGIIVLVWLEKFGHTPVLLVGGSTGRIGDPSGKSIERPFLSDHELEKNVIGICNQFNQYFNDPVIVNNDEWWSQLNAITFLRDIGKLFRVGPMMNKESVRSRLNSEEGISFTEFSYQVLQGYDFFHLFNDYGVSMQMGGGDQWGNITAGVEFTRKMTGKAVHGLTFPLLMRRDGKKFGKSESGAIWLDPKKTTPYQLYQYLIRTPDTDVIQLLKMLTFVDLSEIIEYEQAIESGSFIPNKAQQRLAEEVTRFVHGEEGVNSSIKVTQAIAPGSDAVLDGEVFRSLIKDIPHLEMRADQVIGKTYVEVLVDCGLLKSRGQGTRLVSNGGAYLNNQKIVDARYVINSTDFCDNEYLLLGTGKKQKFLIHISPE